MCNITFKRALQCRHWVRAIHRCLDARYEKVDCAANYHKLFYNMDVNDFCSKDCAMKNELWLQHENKEARAREKVFRSTAETRQAGFRLKAAERELADVALEMETAQGKMDDDKNTQGRANERLKTASNARDRNRAQDDADRAYDAYRRHKGIVDRASVRIEAIKKKKANAERDMGTSKAPAQIAAEEGEGGD